MLEHGDPKEIGQLQCSKWLTLPLLLSKQELEACLLSYSNLFVLGSLKLESELICPLTSILEKYEALLTTFWQGGTPDPKLLRGFSYGVTPDSSDVYIYSPDGERGMIKEKRPLIYLQPLLVHFSPEDLQFRTKVRGGETFFWGVELRFPQLFQLSTSGKIEQAWGVTQAANDFRNLQRWARKATEPVQFLHKGKKLSPHLRVGHHLKGKLQDYLPLQQHGLDIWSS